MLEKLSSLNNVPHTIG